MREKTTKDKIKETLILGAYIYGFYWLVKSLIKDTASE